MVHEEDRNRKAVEKNGSEMKGGTGSMLQNSASILPEQGQRAAPVRKQIGKAKQDKRGTK